jgi:UDP-2-acetamido-2,6-beta-L-arabino-hexul-4-ose reductase
MKKVGITGQEGFIGKHLYNTLYLNPEEFELVDFKRDYFSDPSALESFVDKCDVIIHLAALNRHNDPEEIYKVNVDLVQKLIYALNITNSKAHLIFSSSSQEDRKNIYGESKKVGRELLTEWATKSGAKFTGLIIPNVFGPFGHSFYNSFIATFSYQLTHNEKPCIDSDSNVDLIYVGDLVKAIISEINNPICKPVVYITATDRKKVSEVLLLLNEYKTTYQDNNIIPVLRDQFEVNLFNTFRSYIDLKKHYPVRYIQHTDTRGSFIEIVRLNIGGQVSFSTTLPSITRGNHFHTRKIERFSVIKGNALIQLRKIGDDEIIDFHLSGDKPAFVDMPIWYTHNITNTGDEDLYTVFWINEFFNTEDPDTYFENV